MHGVTSVVRRKGCIVLKRSRTGAALPDVAWTGKIGKHPNIVVVLWCSNDGSDMRMLYGGECLDWGMKTPDQVIDIMAQTLDGLGYLRNKFLCVHMDIKPENLLLDIEGVLRICDLGGLLRDGASFPAIPVGTPFFMTPDSARSDGCVTENVFLWALGICALIWLGAYEAYDPEESCACLYRVGRLRSVDYQSTEVHSDSVIYKYWAAVFTMKKVGRYYSAACTSSTQQLRELIQPRRGPCSTP